MSVKFGESSEASEKVASSAVQGSFSTTRSSRIDLLRGLFLTVMMLDHLPHNPLGRFTSQSLGFMSAAEGFVFVSGLVSAWVYGRILARQGEVALRQRALHRARDIYLTHLFLLTLPLLSSLATEHRIVGVFAELGRVWWHGALRGILPMYAVFMLLIPPLLKQLARGRLLLVGLVSLTLWTAAQFGVGTPAHNLPLVQIGFFNLLAWQLLFVAGAFFGYRQAAGLRPTIPVSRKPLALSIVVVTLVFIVRHQNLFFGNFSFIDTNAALTDWKSICHPLRMINFSAWAYIAWSIPRSADLRMHGLSAFRFLRYIGQHSLQVFAWSDVVSFLAISLKGSWATLSPVSQVFLAVAATLSLAIPAWLHEHWRRSSPQRSAALMDRITAPS